MGFRRRQFEFGEEDLPEYVFDSSPAGVRLAPPERCSALEKLDDTQELDADDDVTRPTRDRRSGPDRVGASAFAEAEGLCAEPAPRGDAFEVDELEHDDSFAAPDGPPVSVGPSMGGGARGESRSRRPRSRVAGGRGHVRLDGERARRGLAIGALAVVVLFVAWSALTADHDGGRPERAQTPPSPAPRVGRPVHLPTIGKVARRPRRGPRAARRAPRPFRAAPVRETSSAAAAPARAPATPPEPAPVAPAPPAPAPDPVAAPPPVSATPAPSGAAAAEEFGFER